MLSQICNAANPSTSSNPCRAGSEVPTYTDDPCGLTDCTCRGGDCDWSLVLLLALSPVPSEEFVPGALLGSAS